MLASAGRGEVDVVTDEGVMRVGHVVITADAWTNRLLGSLGLEIPMVVTREQVSYFPHDDLDARRNEEEHVRRRPCQRAPPRETSVVVKHRVAPGRM